MNTKQLFFFSLIVLSIAMGMNWFKNRPVKKPVKEVKVENSRKAISLTDKDLQLKKDDESEDEEDEDSEDKQDKEFQGNKKYEGEVGEENEEDGDEENNTKEEGNGENEIASASSDITASETQEMDNPLKDDPILKNYFQVTRNPFEPSPYAQLVERLRIEAELAAHPKEVEKKEVKIPKLMGSAKFNGTIETDRGPKVIVDGNIYEKGNELNGCIIREIMPNLIVLSSGSDKYLLPKTGVVVNIDSETGEYTIDDSFE